MAKNDNHLSADGDIAPRVPVSTGSVATDIQEPITGDESVGLMLKDKDMTKKNSGAIADRLRTGGEKLATDAGEKARGLVSDGLERTAEALTNVSKMVGDTADGIDERLGKEYGDYARKAASALDKASTTIASKNADELIEDTRSFVRNSPGIALAGAAVVGFVMARLLKSGLATDTDED